MLLINYSKPGSAHAINKWFHCRFKRLGVHVLLASYARIISPVAEFRLNGVRQEREQKSETKHRGLARKAHRFRHTRYIFCNLRKRAFFDWLSNLTDSNTFKKKRNIVWTPELIQTVQNLDNPITQAVDFWLTSVLEGYVTEFAVDQRKSFSAAERYFS